MSTPQIYRRMTSVDPKTSKSLILVSSRLTKPFLFFISIVKYATERGSFKISMSIYEDNTYAVDKEYTSSPSIGIGTYVYAEVKLEDVQDSHLVVTMDQCYATQTRDPADPTTAKHYLIDNR